MCIAGYCPQFSFKGVWTDNTRNAKIKGDQIEVFKILNGYENIDSNICLKLRKVQ